MAVAGMWASQQPQLGQYADANKWGNGVSSIHADRNTGTGRGTAQGGSLADPVPQLLDANDYNGNGWSGDDSWLSDFAAPTGTDENSPNAIGVSDRPEWGNNSDMGFRQATTKGYPSWRQSGAWIRSVEHGATASITANVTPEETVTEGWQNKLSQPDEYDAFMPDESSLYMQTSFIQRDKVREGSQRGLGSASEYSAPIKSRTMGPKIKPWSDSDARRYDMTPRDQEQMMRPWWGRTGGTGWAEQLKSNAAYQATPLTRTPPPDAWQGHAVGAGLAYGYTTEDDQSWAL